jgi:hypothetical protein
MEGEKQMNRLIGIILPISFYVCLIIGCNSQPKKADFQAQKPVIINILTDSTKKNIQADSIKPPPVPDSLRYGFKMQVLGEGEYHFFDDKDRHTGPAMPDEYMPIVESLLKQPNLHEQERAGLENIKAKIIRTGSAAEFATTRKVPNLFYQMDGEGRLKAEYKGPGEVTLRIKTFEESPIHISLKIWNDRIIKNAEYEIPAGAGQSGQLALSAMMDDFVISWDTDGDGKDDRETEPQKLDSVAVAK